MEPDRPRNYEHNLEVLNLLAQGDLVKFNRGGYTHWAVYRGNNNVIHLRGEPGGDVKNVFSVDGKNYNKVRAVVDDFWVVASDSKADKDNYLDNEFVPKTPAVIVETAQKFTEFPSLPYHLLWCNCEHFATFCRYGIEHSRQVEVLGTWLRSGAIGTLAVAGISALIKKLKKMLEERRQRTLQEGRTRQGGSTRRKCIVL